MFQWVYDTDISVSWGWTDFLFQRIRGLKGTLILKRLLLLSLPSGMLFATDSADGHSLRDWHRMMLGSSCFRYLSYKEKLKFLGCLLVSKLEGLESSTGTEGPNRDECVVKGVRTEASDEVEKVRAWLLAKVEADSVLEVLRLSASGERAIGVEMPSVWALADRSWSMRSSVASAGSCSTVVMYSTSSSSGMMASATPSTECTSEAICGGFVRYTAQLRLGTRTTTATATVAKRQMKANTELSGETHDRRVSGA